VSRYGEGRLPHPLKVLKGLGMLQSGIRAPVSTLSLHGPINRAQNHLVLDFLATEECCCRLVE
jgi:hypothetical protein